MENLRDKEKKEIQKEKGVILITEKFSSRFSSLLDEEETQLCTNCEEEYIFPGEHCQFSLSDPDKNEKIRAHFKKEKEKRQKQFIKKPLPNLLIKKKQKTDKYEKLNEDLVYKIQNIILEKGKIKSIEFSYNKKKYIIFIEDYTLPNNINESTSIKYKDCNIARIIRKNTGVFYPMNYFKELGGFFTLNSYITKVITLTHNN